MKIKGEFMGRCLEDLSQNQSLKDRVYDNIKTQIIMGNLKPGERLREEELSKAMKISRAPIREALNRLEQERFTTLIPRKGAVVTRVTERDIKDILKMRILLEPYAASKSVHQIPEHEIDFMHETLEKLRNESYSFAAYMQSDIALHELLYKYLDNPILRDTLNSIKEHSLRIRYLAEIHDSVVDTSVIAQSIKEHLEILTAMKARNGMRLFILVKRHLRNAEKRALLTVAE